MDNLNDLIQHILNKSSIPKIDKPVIVFESDKSNNLHPSGLIEAKDAEKYADWWMDNQ